MHKFEFVECTTNKTGVSSWMVRSIHEYLPEMSRSIGLLSLSNGRLQFAFDEEYEGMPLDLALLANLHWHAMRFTAIRAMISTHFRQQFLDMAKTTLVELGANSDAVVSWSIKETTDKFLEVLNVN